MNVLLVEPYFTGSHRAWAEGYAAHSRHDVRLVTHPGRWWKWRMRGAALTLARAIEGLQGWQPDLVLVTDMVDLAHLRTFARRRLGDVPWVLYLHESQLTYPTSPAAGQDLSFALTNWLSAAAADRVLFNSGYHREVFFDSLPRLLRQFPDLTHTHLMSEVEARCGVLPVGVDLSWVSERIPSRPPRILWNHRWEHDKDPDRFAQAVASLLGRGVELQLALLGPRPPKAPPALQRIRRVAGPRIVHDLEAPLEVYRKVVAESDIVVSTARQEFFGVSVVEAVAAGCRPVLPARLSYPWLVPERYHEEVLYEDGALVEALLAALRHPSPPTGLADSMKRFGWDRMAPEYDRLLEEMAR